MAKELRKIIVSSQINTSEPFWAVICIRRWVARREWEVLLMKGLGYE